MQRSWSVENFDFQIQYGIGILHVEEHNRDKDEIIKGLEYAVMLAKRSEDNKTCVCTADMMERLHRNERILELLRRCIQEDSFVVVYQPIYDVKEQAYTQRQRHCFACRRMIWDSLVRMSLYRWLRKTD